MLPHFIDYLTYSVESLFNLRKCVELTQHDFNLLSVGKKTQDSNLILSTFSIPYVSTKQAFHKSTASRVCEF